MAYSSPIFFFKPSFGQGPPITSLELEEDTEISLEDELTEELNLAELLLEFTEEMLAASYATGGSTYIEDRMSTLASEVSFSVSIGLNTSGMSFVAAGYRGYDYEKSMEKQFVNMKKGGYYSFPEEYVNTITECFGGGVSKYASIGANT